MSCFAWSTSHKRSWLEGAELYPTSAETRYRVEEIRRSVEEVRRGAEGQCWATRAARRKAEERYGTRAESRNVLEEWGESMDQVLEFIQERLLRTL